MQTNYLLQEQQYQKGEETVQEYLSLQQQEFNKLSNSQKIQRGLQITRHIVDSQIYGEIIIPDDVQSFKLLSIEVSPFPTQSRKIMKNIETDQLKKFLDINNFVQVDNYCVVFANVEDLSYHNFENILNLDHLFNSAQFKIKTKQLLGKKVQIFKMEGSMDILLSLDRLNYYTVPLNNSQRGGRRLIFHSNQLSFSLTKMIEESEFFDKKNFSHVNNVFRLNNFTPGDKKFKSHYDTPFADKSNNLYPRNSVIKKGQPPLTIGKISLDQIKENECIIFDQQYEHEGNAYIDKNKIFIRTELIYKINYMDYDEKVARMFNMACYMTKEPEQQQYSADLFNSCVKMRYRKQEEVQRVYLVKKNLDIVYVTDGNYYWFSNDIEFEFIVLLIILDYFNGKIYNLKNVRIQSKTLPRQNNKSEEESDETIFNYIQLFSFTQDEIYYGQVENYQNTKDFVPNSLCEDFTTKICGCGLSGGGNQSANQYFQQEKAKAVKNLKNILDQNSVLIFDNLIKINYENIEIQMDDQKENDQPSGKIVLSNFFINTQKKINFASCQCEDLYYKEDIVSFETKRLHTFCLPDISFQKFPNGVKLSIDMFNNGFVHCSTNTFIQPYTDESNVDENKSKREQQEQQSYKYNYKIHNHNVIDDDNDDYNDDEDDDNDDDNDDDIDDDDDDDNLDDNDGLENDVDKRCKDEEECEMNENESKENKKKRPEFEEYGHVNIKLAKV